MESINYPEEKNLDIRTNLAIKLFHEISQGSKLYGWDVAFLSGFAVDAHIGYLTKNHKDVDIIISKEEAKELAFYLTNLGHTVYESEKYKGDCLKVDQMNPEKDTQASCDIHYYWEENDKVVIPLLGEKLIFTDSFSEITERVTFLGEEILVLKPKYLLEEKKGWCEQIKLSQCIRNPEIYNADIKKILSLGSNFYKDRKNNH